MYPSISTALCNRVGQPRGGHHLTLVLDVVSFHCGVVVFAFVPHTYSRPVGQKQASALVFPRVSVRDRLVAPGNQLRFPTRIVHPIADGIPGGRDWAPGVPFLL